MTMECLDKNKFMREVAKTFGSVGVVSKAIEGIAEKCAAADVVEVVRCKDCSFCRYVPSAEIFRCDRRGYFSEEVKPNGFCSCGERRE